ncbi:hypothetical protein [Haloarchaeobius sp. DT45]|uniref:hypothetical protein n=1 Tax=Haloarchaeobius sp. DT45 TaxID=3446116 RepID=UPI003F6C046D
MTNSTLDTGSSLDMDELFADPDAEPAGESEPTTEPENPTESDDIEDVTAGELFQQLSADHAATVDSDDGYAELSDETPEEIIASADEAVEPMDEVDDAIAADDDLLDDLLLSGRTKADGFLWVETADDDADPEDEVASLFDSSPEESGPAPAEPAASDAEPATSDSTPDHDSGTEAGSVDAEPAEPTHDAESAPTDAAEPAEPTDAAESDPSLDTRSALDATFDDPPEADDRDEADTADASSEDDEADDDTDDDGSSGGLASKIRSILSS